MCDVDSWNMSLFENMMLRSKAKKYENPLVIYVDDVDEVTEENWHCIPKDTKSVYMCDVFILTDKEGKTKIIKNRFGPNCGDKKSEVEINISGFAGTGKTVFAESILSLLENFGFEGVEVNDGCDGDFGKRTSLESYKILKSLSKKVKVKINTLNKIRRLS